jgi:hypothetical protein
MRFSLSLSIAVTLLACRTPVFAVPLFSACAPGQDAVAKPTCSGQPQKQFAFLATTNQTIPDNLISIVIGAIEGSGGSLKSNLTISKTFKYKTCPFLPHSVHWRN